MLSGASRGRRKLEDRHSASDSQDSNSHPQAELKIRRKTCHAVATNYSSVDNLGAAEELRRFLASIPSELRPKDSLITQQNDVTEFTLGNSSAASDIPNKVGPHGSAPSTTGALLIHEPSRNFSQTSSRFRKTSLNSSEADKSIKCMMREEILLRVQGYNCMDEIFSENVPRVGSQCKMKNFKLKRHESSSGAYQEDDCRSDAFEDNKKCSDLSYKANYNREKMRQINLADKECWILNKCWWWIQSSSFRKHMLLSLGDHVSLVLSPCHLSLVSMQCILVPIQQVEAYSGCDDDVWDELVKFKSSLRSMFSKLDKGVLFTETVFPSKNLWQARIDVFPVPKSVEADAAIFFRSAMADQVDEWGTHNKIFSTNGRASRGIIPKGFPYFSIDWNDGGYAMVIESSSFPKNFCADTIASMADMEPIRFSLTTKSSRDEKQSVGNFISLWKDFDWTCDLDCASSSKKKR